MSNHLTAALEYAAAGYCVLPLNGKIPLTTHGAHDSSTDAAVIRAWFGKWPHADIGISLAGLVVVDIDPRNGGAIAALQSLPATCTASTGGGGLHYLYKARDGVRYAGKLAQGVDQKTGAGAYIVVAPSLHAGGNAYQWLTSPLDSAPTEAPEWMASTVAYVPRKRSSKPRNNASAWYIMGEGEHEAQFNPLAERIHYSAETESLLAIAAAKDL